MACELREPKRPSEGQPRRRVRTILMLCMPLCLFTVGCTQSFSEPTQWENALLRSPLTESAVRPLWLLAGVLLLLAGRRLHRFIIAAPGFLLGGTLGAILAADHSSQTMYVLAAALAGGILAAWLSYRVFRLGVFLCGALSSIVILNTLYTSTGIEQTPVIAILIAAVVGGTLFLGLIRVWMPLVSSALGTAILGIALDMDLWLMLLVLAVGVLVQYGITRAFGRNAFKRSPDD